MSRRDKFIRRISNLYFDCSIISKDKKKFLKEFSIKYKKKMNYLNLM